MTSRISGLLLLGVCLLTLSPFVARADSISPAATTLSVLPGEQAYHTLHLVNNSLQPQTYAIDIQAVAFAVSADDLHFSALPPSKESWITVNPEQARLDSGAEQAIEIMITVPVEAESEAFAVAVVASAQTAVQTGVGVSTGFASLIFVNVGESLATNLQITAFDTVPVGSHHLPMHLATLITNTGSGLAEPKIGVVIKNIWGKEVEVIPMNPTGKRVPANTNRVFTADWVGNPWRFGPFTAELYVFPDDSATVLSSKIRMVLFPWRTLSILAIFSLVFVGSAYAVRRLWRRQAGT